MLRLGPALLALLGACAGCTRPATPRPTVILVSIDTLRADHVGLYGYERDTTPFLDQWSRGAIVFEQAFTPAPWTLIAHMTMLTGLYPAQHGVVAEDKALSAGVATLAERLAALGYQTVGLYRESWIHERYGFGRGFEVFRAHDEAEEAGLHLSEELERLDPGRPLFLFLHLFDVHNGVAKEGSELLYPSPAPYQDMFLDGPPEPLPELLPDDLWNAQGILTPAQVHTIVAHYDGGIRHVDAQLERWFADLGKRGLLSDALVIVTSDHGESLAQRGTLDGHGGLAQEGLRVPLIVGLPTGLRAGTRVSSPVHLADLVPTVLGVLGAQHDDLPGLSLLGPLPVDRVLAGAYPPSDYVVLWPKKLMRRGQRVLEADLEKDPGELQLRPASDARFEELLGLSSALGTGYPKPEALEAMSADQRAALQALGYAGDR